MNEDQPANDAPRADPPPNTDPPASTDPLMGFRPRTDGKPGTGSDNDGLVNTSAGAVLSFFALEWVLLFPLAEHNETVKELIPQYWWLTLAPPAVFGFVIWAFPWAAQKWRSVTTTTIVAIIFLGFGLLSLGVMGIVFVPGPWQMPVLRFLFILVASLLPGVLCYLFVITKRHSLLNEFLINVEKLGLLPDNFAEMGDASAELVLEVYFRKFESVYGPLDEASRKQAIREIVGRVGTVKALQTAQSLKPPSDAAIAATGTGDGSLRKDIDDLGVHVLPANLGYPLVLATLLISLGWLLALPLTHVRGDGADWADAFVPEATPVNFAFLGAYFFSMQMLFRRYVVRDVSGSAYTSVSIRILLAVIGTWAVLAAWAALPALFPGLAAFKPFERVPAEAPNGLNYGGLVIGFVIGVFPEIAWQIIRDFFARVFKNIVLRTFDNEMPLRMLDGLTVWHETRLAEEDVENVPNMATVEIAQLMLHTPFPPERIIDWVDQAILYTHLGEAKEPRETLRKHGIRTASGLLAAHAGSVQKGDDNVFENMLGTAAVPAVVGAGRSCIRSLLDAIKTEANLKLVLNWNKV